jgi:hypothetical protein
LAGAKQGAALGTSVACVGLILSTMSMSGIGVKLITGIEEWSSGYLFLALFLVWVISIIMGMGGSSITSYIIVVVLVSQKRKNQARPDFSIRRPPSEERRRSKPTPESPSAGGKPSMRVAYNRLSQPHADKASGERWPQA